ncbi:hypothetical protein ANN_00862 [Periplaneta americana]|uniref:Uncharacterized protein n=1 Tax=Periplaneta americana TaxID=6978 RepID=A0ABQ8TUD7_PERAM|nr:hypothetical protein ANN_00862 [Periplaneta americana]
MHWHDCLAQHLHRFDLLPDPKCTLCDLQEDMNRDHLFRCPTLTKVKECADTGRRDGGAQLLITRLCTNMPGLNPKSLRSAYEQKAYVTLDNDSSVGRGR